MPSLWAAMKNAFFLITLLTLAACNSTSSQTASVNGVIIDYTVQGDGPPLYFLHGGMESRDSFNKQIPEFSKFFTVVALDSREQGRSSRADEQISYELMSKDVVALADYLGHERISILGSSDGGVVAMTTAINHPVLSISWFCLERITILIPIPKKRVSLLQVINGTVIQTLITIPETSSNII